jgi:hypothetical protein
MRPMTALLLAVLCGAVVSCAPTLPERPALPLPPVIGNEAPGLPTLPRASPRSASYSIDARLDPERHTIAGSLALDWHNTSGRPLASFPFHLYWNAFRNNLSTSARREGRRTPGDATRDERSFGWIQVKTVRLVRATGAGVAGAGAASAGAASVAEAEEDLTPTLRYLTEDGNANDRTVMEVRTAQPVPSGARVRFRIEWDTLVPHGSVGRSGWVHDYNFIAQWFPKIGVFQDGAWSCHPFYPWTEFFSDFGVYDVRLRLPRGFVVGATGRLQERTENPDGTDTFRFVQEDVHDFAWTASRRFLERKARFDEPGYPQVEIRLLVQPEHAQLAARYIEATKIALRTYGTWSAPYPYAQITVVDPAWGSSSGGMEYPTLFTGGTPLFAPRELQSPEAVTVHEAGHQFWYGLVASNEAEESWLDEGFDTYMTAKALDHALGSRGWGRRFFGDDDGRRARMGWPVVAAGVAFPHGSEALANLRAGGSRDVMAKRAWTYRDAGSYRLNSYGKPALVLQTLEGLLGEQTMLKVLRSYARRFRFAHPTTADFIATVDEVTGQDWGWFFDETFFSSELCDYAVEVRNAEARTPTGWFEGPGGRLVMKRRERTDTARPQRFESRVTVVRNGGVRLPVELRVELEDGRSLVERWDGQDRWRRFEYKGAKVVRAVVDPDRKIAIDVDPVNNEWISNDGPAWRASTKWAARFLLWLQTFLELQTAVG